MGAVWGNKKWEPHYKAQLEKNQLDRLQMVQFKCRKYRNPCVPLIFGWTPFSHFQLSGVIRKAPVWSSGRWKFYGTKSAQQAGNAPISMPQALKPLCLIHFWVNPFFSFSALWGNKKWEPQYEAQEDKNFMEQHQLNRLGMVQFECPKYRNPFVSHPFVGESIFLIFSSLG